MVPFIRHKRGNTLTLTCVYQDSAGKALSLSGVKVKSDAIIGTSRYALSASITNSAKGEFTLSARADETKAWPIGVLECDIQYIQGSNVASSETFHIHVIKQVTHAD